jgi:hypothetical protein
MEGMRKYPRMEAFEIMARRGRVCKVDGTEEMIRFVHDRHRGDRI